MAHLRGDRGDCRGAGADHPRHPVNAQTRCQRITHRPLALGVQFWPAEWLAALGATLPNPGEPGTGALTDANTLLLCERGHHRQHDVPYHLVVCR